MIWSKIPQVCGINPVRVVRGFTNLKTIQTLIIGADDFEARRKSAAVNIQRENLSGIETIGGTLAALELN
jgi:hypothetical protein